MNHLNRRRPAIRNKPTPSNYQKFLRKTTIKLVVLFALSALAIGTAIYYYQRKHMMP